MLLTMRSLFVAHVTVSIIPFTSQFVGAVSWDRPKADPEAPSPDVEYLDNSFSDTIPPYEGTLPDVALNQYGNASLGDNTLVNRAAKDFYLRVMPLGASITQGQGSTDETGYRKSLRQQLRWKGWKVNMVGSKRNGAMADNDNEGWPGYVINSVYNQFQKSAYLKPNLVLINAGTNDCGDTGDGANAARDMKAMINGVFDSIDGVTVILSTLVPSGKNNVCASFVSQQYRDLVENSFAGRRIGLADINSAMGLDLLHDDTHPNDQGYKLFAAVWWDAISKLEDVIQPPSPDGPNDATSANSCRKVAGTARGPIRTQQGSGHDDGNYVHSSEPLGNLISARIEYKGDSPGLNDLIPFRMFFANLIKTDPNAQRKDALDDWVRAWNNGEYNTLWHVRRNKGNGEFDTSQQFDIDQHCEPGSDAHGYTWGDFNGDGLDDFFCLRYDGAVTLSLNRAGNPPQFEYVGQIIGGAGPEFWDYTQQDFRFADIDGDGRADFCILTPYNVKCSRNGGQGDEHFWQGFEAGNTIRDLVFGWDEKMDPSRMVLGDINGDFRADFMYVSDTGSVQTWINQRGDGNTIVPQWRSAGLTHVGQAVSGLKNRIKFGKILGSNRLDYIYLVEEDEWNDVRVWRNTGSGGTKRKGDGSFYCDMRGTGSDDLVWIYDAGNVDEINTNIHSPPNWGHDTSISFSVPGPRVGIHLADWTGNGRCDVLVQNKASGALTLYENQYDQAAKSITFANRGVVASPGCTQGWGVSIFDRGMRLADVDGDGRADILCLETTGRITGWLNRASGLMNVGQIKFAEAWDRANLRFADVERSGRADIIWLNKYTGAGTVYTNNGFQGVGGGPGGSSFQWTNRGILYAPISRGETMHFTNQGGLGRADLVHVVPATNEANTYFNECGAAGGDDGPITDPGLPYYESCPPPCTQSVPINFSDNTCSNAWKVILRREMSNAYDMALATRDHLQEGDYFNHFFSQNLRNQASFAGDITETYRRMADMLSGRSSTYTFSVSCDETKEACWERGWYASMNDGTQIMNFCAKFFNDPRVKNSDEVLNECNSINLRDAQFTRAAIIVHEASHTYYTMRDGPPSIDVAYGYTSCTNLPLGLFDRSCVPYGGLKKRSDGTFTPAICPNQAGGEGFCNGDMSARNADTYSHVAAGVYFSRQCNRAIPYPQPVALAARAQTRNSAAVNESAERETTALAAEAVAIVKTRKRKLEPITAPKEARHPHDSRRLNQTLHEPGTLAVHQSKPRANSCPYINDFIVWDGNDEGASGITGYAHFGDSYASGMGTGTTSGDKCRVGSNNYGDLIYQLLNDKSISYERRSCSGDTTDGLYNKIDAWGNAAQVTVATLTMGGNDLGFADLVYYCVITPNTAQPFGSVNRKWCVDAENKARDHMNDMSDNGLRARLKDGYLRILRKSGRRDLNMYVAGYPVFFNEETTDCDQSSFHYLFGGYKPPSDWPFNRIVYLTRDLRKELDDLVRQLNSVIQDAISDANTAQGGNQVHFVDVVPAFSDGLHRWCEEGVHEPDSSRSDTWFFLSAWPDAGDPNAAAAEAAELQAMFAQGPIALPDANSCNTTLGANPDPYAVAMCNLAQTVRDAPDGPEAQRFGRANADLSSGNFNSQDVPWYAPTRQVKTFHPRTSGMIAYRDAIFKQIQANGQR